MSREDGGDLVALRMERLRLMLRQGLDDVAAGRTVDGRRAFAALRARFEAGPEPGPLDPSRTP